MAAHGLLGAKISTYATLQGITKPPIFQLQLLKNEGEVQFQAPRVGSCTLARFQISHWMMTWGANRIPSPKTRILGLSMALRKVSPAPGGNLIAVASGTEGDYEIDVLSLPLYIGKCNILTPIKTFTVEEVGKRSEICHSLFRPVIGSRCWSNLRPKETRKTHFHFFQQLRLEAQNIRIEKSS
ncbi:hypothetical protein BC826DRAFT_316377 [Russula brevipes]|nr:hypothetical protein BC826DRAFT_316377 [Russula brevipes]